MAKTKKKKRYITVINLSKLALASLACGLLAIVMPGALKIILVLAAVVLGAVGLKKINSSHGALYGKSIALAGIVIGPLLLVIMLITGPISERIALGHEREVRKICASNLRKFDGALKRYQREHEGRLPASLVELFPKYIDEPRIYWCPGDKDRCPKTINSENDTLISYIYTPPKPGDERKLWQIEIMTDNSTDNHPGTGDKHAGAGRNMLMGDGICIWAPEKKGDGKKALPAQRDKKRSVLDVEEK